MHILYEIYCGNHNLNPFHDIDPGELEKVDPCTLWANTPAPPPSHTLVLTSPFYSIMKYSVITGYYLSAT